MQYSTAPKKAMKEQIDFLCEMFNLNALRSMIIKVPPTIVQIKKDNKQMIAIKASRPYCPSAKQGELVETSNNNVNMDFLIFNFIV